MPTPIHLNLPRGWNALTTPQLEAVAKIFIEESRAYTASGRFDRTALLTRAFFALSGLRVISLAHSDEAESNEESVESNVDTTPAEGASAPAEHPTLHFTHSSLLSPETTYYNCEFIDDAERTARQTVDGRIVPIRIYLDEIMSLAIGDYTQKDLDQYLKAIDRYQRRIAAGKEAEEPAMPEPKSPLGWLLSPCTLTIVPYPELTLSDPKTSQPHNLKTSKPHTLITLKGPNELMDGMSWRQYRIAGDYMQYLAKCENHLVRLQQQAARTLKTSHPQTLQTPQTPQTPQTLQTLQTQLAAAEQQVREVRAQFLATLFDRPIPHIDPDTGLTVTSPWYTSSQSQDNAYLFQDFPEEQFQVISFWWQGMMLHLQREFPLVFRREKVKGDGKDADPLALYTRSTATMIKYSAANEEEVNRTSYTIILQHINDMAEENKRIEEMKKK